VPEDVPGLTIPGSPEAVRAMEAMGMEAEGGAMEMESDGMGSEGGAMEMKDRGGGMEMEDRGGGMDGQ
jgi:hypothetical protein